MNNTQEYPTSGKLEKGIVSIQMATKTKDKPRNCAFIGETRRRSWLKSIVWRIIGIAILGGITWLITRSWEQTSVITLFFHTVRLVLYYYHERAWDNVEWGRIKVREDLDRGEGI